MPNHTNPQPGQFIEDQLSTDRYGIPVPSAFSNPFLGSFLWTGRPTLGVPLGARADFSPTFGPDSPEFRWMGDQWQPVSPLVLGVVLEATRTDAVNTESLAGVVALPAGLPRAGGSLNVEAFCSLAAANANEKRVRIRLANGSSGVGGTEVCSVGSTATARWLACQGRVFFGGPTAAYVALNSSVLWGSNSSGTETIHTQNTATQDHWIKFTQQVAASGGTSVLRLGSVVYTPPGA